MLALSATTLAGLAMEAPAALAARNVNFVGSWVPNTGLAWTITRENRRTGVCGGITASPSYHIVNCRVHGRTYTFTVTFGTAYKSYNKGTIRGNSLAGTFHDTNGTTEAYTAVRQRRKLKKRT